KYTVGQIDNGNGSWLGTRTGRKLWWAHEYRVDAVRVGIVTVSIKWPRSRDEVWKENIPHTHLAQEKSDQNRMVVKGEKISFPVGGTHFHYGADKYIASLANLQRDGILLLELNRLLKPGGYFAYSSLEAYAQDEEDLKIWREMSTLVERMCWKIAAKRNQTVIWVKPLTNECYEERKPSTRPPVCRSDDDPDTAWEVPMEACITPYSDLKHPIYMQLLRLTMFKNDEVTYLFIHQLKVAWGTFAATSDGKSKEYGFIQFNLEESATAAISNLNGSMIEDKQMLLKDEKYTNLMYYNYVAKFIKRSGRLSSQDKKYTNLHMKNLDEE
ncbi:hypothetical protein GIB67_037683, partial [Kingdonia uniflora]